MTITNIFTACVPREDIQNGTFSEANFAARLGSVISGNGPDDYVIASRFFANTHPTTGLRSLVSEVLRRLGGDGDAPSIFRLDTSFGGGKTHGLIALVHAARRSDQDGDGVYRFIEYKGVHPVAAEVAAFDGEAADPTNGRLMADAIRAYTPWGEIAHQLGGASAYEIVRKSDEMRRAPGADTIAEIIGDKPTLILLDELGEYLRKCPDALGRDQIAAFLKALFSAAETKRNVAIVFTLAVRQDGKATDAFARENEEIARIIAELESVSGRKATILNPTSDDETAAVLRARLFEHVEVPEDVVAAYAALWNEHYDRIAVAHVVWNIECACRKGDRLE